ncbi:alpha/beta-hydrolase [Saccharata proteae CBS 121410]|uniref:Alpha/beta-hydrolase n=1 Tax=Saccharata proteae CBS 121410 TaxID=1314787 RepID=A0A9P4HTD8_9PEZI|nr:alpha/beta-hydrolase [Saccharata proteae CBS 121410]
MALGMSSASLRQPKDRHRPTLPPATMGSQATHPIIPSPRTTLLPGLSQSDVQNLPYPPDALPGARDVESPYGTFRVHEWGPEGGQKVLMVHGISTPLVAFAPIARLLVARGYRVMLFDLFGRGYSDGPSDLPHDSRLYTTQILLALQSSPLSWMGSKTNTFHLLGYSFGGGISADFASYFPHLVSSLVLIAPGGIVRDTHVTWKSKLLYHTRGLLPDSLVHWLVSRRLHTPQSSNDPASAKPESSVIDTAAQAETGGGNHHSHPATNTDPYHPSNAPPPKQQQQQQPRPIHLLPNRPNVTVTNTVNWQLAHHPGFVPAFVSSIRHGPIHNQHHRWRILGAHLSARKALDGREDPVVRRVDSDKGEVLVLLGAEDPIVLVDELSGDAEAVLGRGNVVLRVFGTGHELPMSCSGECVEAMVEFWEGKGVGVGEMVEIEGEKVGL